MMLAFFFFFFPPRETGKNVACVLGLLLWRLYAFLRHNSVAMYRNGVPLHGACLRQEGVVAIVPAFS